MNSIKEGDEVRIFSRSRYRTTAPEGGWAGKVVKVGRKYATAEYVATSTVLGKEERYNKTIEFDMTSGYERGSVSNTCDQVRTPEQVELDRRRDVALSVLKEHDLEVRFGRRARHSTECLEAIAEVLKTFDSGAR